MAGFKPLRISREVLAQFLPNHDSIRQFEKLLESIDDLDEAIDDRVGALIQDGTGITWVYDDAADTLTGNVSLSPFDTDDLSEGANLYYTDGRVAIYIKANILEYGSSSISSSATVTKTKTFFTGSTAGQTITLPTAGTSGREVEVFNISSVEVAISGSSQLSELYPNESACFTDTGADWVA